MMAGMSDLDWDDLRFFLRALEAKSLAGAARSLGVEHSTVGRRLSALERSLGAPLVLRGPQGLQLTPLGEKLAPLVHDMGRAAAAVDDLVNAQKATIRLAVPSGFTRIFATALSQPNAKGLRFSLDILSGARPHDLAKGEADLAIRAAPLADQNLIASKLCEAGFSLYASATYFDRRPAPADPNDLTGHEVIGYHGGLSAAPPAKWLEQHAAGAVIVLRSQDMADVLSAALSGIGLAVLPCLLGDAAPALTRLTPQVLVKQNLSLVYPRQFKTSEPMRAAIGFVRSVVRQHAGLIGGEGAET
jgi:DNA-binding transcriptional LysR family regulator